MVSANAKNLSELKAAIENFPYCDLKYGARNAVFSAGSPSAKIMIIGEAPGREEDFKGSLLSDALGSFWIRCYSL